MKMSSDLNIKKILNVFYVQKNIIIMVFLVVFALASYLAASLPDVYRSSTSILVTPQELPSSVVNSRTAWSIEQRIRTISQDILSRNQLAKIVEEFNLYPVLSSVDARVERLRRNMVLDVRRNETFVLSFEHVNPEKAMQVASRMGALFLNENVNLSREQATGTTNFISTEASRLRKELEEQESEVNLYRARYRAELPEQLDANLRTLEQIRAELQSNASRLSSLQERKAGLEKQLVEANFVTSTDAEGRKNIPEWRQLSDRRQQLEDLRTRYSERHPDIIRLKNEIQLLEAEEKAQQAKLKGSVTTDASAARNPVQQMLLKQSAELNAEINSLRLSNDALRGQIVAYQAHIDNTPIRAIELSKITRVYDVTLKKYQDMQAKSFDTRLSENMDKAQRGEQFRVVDKANLPQRPVGPNRLAVLFVGLVMALAGGFGAAFLWENMDGSFKSGEEIREHTTVPLLATIPAIATRETILQQRRTQGILVLASAVILVVGIASIHFYGTLYF
jgi:polysaccharide chain length determinant protein (PEP-CTERM system associated)